MKTSILGCIICVLCNSFALQEQKKGFLVTAPSTVLAGSVERVCVSLHNNSESVTVTATLRGSYTGHLLASSNANVTSASCLELGVAQTEEQSARLTVRLDSTEFELSGSSEQVVTIQPDPLVVIVSTDKPIYKPGQQVNFRVLRLSHRLKPHSEKISKIWVEGPNGIRVQQWKNVDVSRQGLVQLQFTLDKEPFMGQWKIKVENNSSKIVDKPFIVKEYVPATFEVIIHPPEAILADSMDVSWHVCAKYSYGEVVQGDAHVEIKLLGSKTADQPTINNRVKLNRHSGCTDLNIGGNVLGLSDPLVKPTAVHVTASVTERGTGVSHTALAVSPVHNQRFSLQFHCSDYFKPGLPYKGNVVMRTMEGHPKLGTGEEIQVCTKVRYQGHLAMKLVQCWNYTTDFTSQVVFALPEIDDPFNVHLIVLTATATGYPTKLYPGSSEVMMIQPSVSHNVKPWFSPSHSYLDVSTRNSLACGTLHNILVHYSVTTVNASTPQFFYLIENRGDLLTLDSVIPKEETVIHSNDVNVEEPSLFRSWRLSIPVTPDMAPTSVLTVYYVQVDGEIVAGTTTLSVERCFQNKVRIIWDQPQTTPKGQAHLCIRASPDSVCGVTVIDRQLSFNTSHPSRKAEDVWDLLKRFTPQKPQRGQRQDCNDKIYRDETPPTYELRRKRSLSIPSQDFSEHVDSITAFDDLGVTVMSNFILETRPCVRQSTPLYISRSGWQSNFNYIVDRSPFIPDNLLMVTNEASSSQDPIQSLVRDHFPDTWIWSLAYVGKDGETAVNSSAPDTITSWDASVFCVSEREGLGMAAPATLTVFMPFFIQVEAPYSIKRGESVTLKIIVYNYMYHPLPILLKIHDNKDLKIVHGENVSLCLKALSPHSHVISVTAMSAGLVNLTVTAEVQPLAGCGPEHFSDKSDTVIKQLIVKNEGFLQQKSNSAFICPSQDSGSITWETPLPEPDNLVLNSARLKFTVGADLLGPALENLDSLVLLPMGCGEQNLARLAPNLFLLKYIKTIGLMDGQRRETITKNIIKGYQRQLTFQRSDGSFSAFGDKDETGSMWLTAAVVRTLGAASDVVEIDTDRLQDSVVWITRQQLENGCFPTIGDTFHSDSEDEETITSSTSSTLSALVVANLVASGLNLPPSLRTNAEFCLTTSISSPEPYTLALTTLALTRLGYRQKALEAMQNLQRLAIVENDVVFWGKHDASLSHNIEITSYAVLSLVELGGSENLLIARKAVRWISTQRNENGGFVTTQDTVVALEALTSYMTSLPPLNQTELMVVVTGYLKKVFRVTENNKLIQQQMVITDNIPPQLTVKVGGDGCALLQSVLKYHVRRPEEGSVMQLEVSTSAVSSVDPCSVQALQLCVRAARPGRLTNMALLTVMMVTGYTVDNDDLPQLSNPSIKKWEDEDDQIVFYISHVNDVPICFNLLLIRKFEVEDPLPAPVTLIDYYRPEISTSKDYSLQCSPVSPLEDIMLSDSPKTAQNDRFNNFHNVDFELETPSGEEGPKPAYVCPPNSTKCK